LDIDDGPRDLPARQRTLRATFAWSHDLLSPVEQAIFRRLGTTVGGYTLDAAEAVCGQGDTRTHGHLQSLAEKHLIRWEETDHGSRITMLESIREFAMERLRDSGEEPGIRRSHALYFLNLIVEAGQHLVGSDQLEWFQRLEAEQGNIRSALEWGLDQRDDVWTQAVRGAVALGRFWLRRRSLSEGITWLERGLARPALDPHLRAQILLSLAHLYKARSEYRQAQTLISEVLPIGRQIGDQAGVATALNTLGEIAEDRGDFQRAADLYEQALTINQENGFLRESARSLSNLATNAFYQGDFNLATARWENALAIFEVEDLWATGVLLGNLGSVAMAAGNFDRAVVLHEENLSIARLLNDPGSIGRGLCNLAEALQMRGDGDQDALLEEALSLHRETNDKQSEISTLTLMANRALARGEMRRAAGLYTESTALCKESDDLTTMVNVALLERIATLALASAQPKNAARLLGACEALRHTLGAPIMPYLRPVVERCMEQVTAQMDAVVLDAAMAEGRMLSSNAAVQEARAVCNFVELGSGTDHTKSPEVVSIAASHHFSP
jgi:tetratricopeptide (TPR) repeat protein